jgi:NADH dehydrogenase
MTASWIVSNRDMRMEITGQNVPHRAVPRVIIVGAGFGGLQVARGLAQAPVRVTVIDRHNYHLFQPLLYQVATAELSPADITAPIRSVLRRQTNTEVLLGEVTAVDAEHREVVVRDCAGAHDVVVPYEYLVLATGAMGSYFGHEAWEPLAPGLKSIDDATTIRRRLLLAFEAAEEEMEANPTKAARLLTFVVVGGGPTGVELAGAIAEVAHQVLVKDFRHIDTHTARVLLIEGEPHLLAPFPADLAAAAERKLRRLGVEIRTGEHVEDVTADGVVVRGGRIAASTVIWAAGVKASPAGQWLGARVDRAGQVLVGADCSIPGHPEIFAIGDTASLADVGSALPGVAPVAMQQGRYVARIIRARVAGETAADTPFSYVDKGMLATVGRAYAIAHLGPVRLYGFAAWIVWMAVHILYLIGFRNRVLVLLQWAWAYLTAQRGARVILDSQGEAKPLNAMTHDGVS